MSPSLTAPRALAAYIVCALVMTWPLPLGLGRDVPSDVGDPVFIAGRIAWAADHWAQLLTGDATAAVRFWDAPFFHPEPQATAFSDHFALHGLVVLPVWLVSGNPILGYNLLFLAAWAFSGWGMFLLVRDLTGRPWAAFVAGLAFAFAPYRIGTLAHLQVQSSLWMPLALLGIHRYFATGRLWPLAGGAAALWAQAASSGYYLVYFGPFVAIFALAEMWSRGLLGRMRVWLHLAGAAAATVAAVLPFSVPYLIVQARYQYRRPLADVMGFSADLQAWLTASPRLTVWGDLQWFPRAEGALFPGVTVVVAALAGWWIAWRRGRSGTPLAVEHRTVARYATVAVPFAFLMALGPHPSVGGEPLGWPGPYLAAYWHVPGYDVARVPSRFAMMLVLSTSLLAGITLARVEGRRWLLALAAVGILLDGAALPLPRSETWTSAPAETHPAPVRLHGRADLPAVYRYLGTLGDDAVIAEFPFGPFEREIQYGYYTVFHGRRILNGYSGGLPIDYVERLPAMLQAVSDPAAAVARLRAEGATHAVVHLDAWIDPGTGPALVEAFEARGLRRAARFGDGVVLQLPPR